MIKILRIEFLLGLIILFTTACFRCSSGDSKKQIKKASISQKPSTTTKMPDDLSTVKDIIIKYDGLSSSPLVVQKKAEIVPDEKLVEGYNPPQKIYKTIKNKKPKKELGLTQYKQLKSDVHYIVDNLPAGYNKDGIIDYTSYIQKSLDTFYNIEFPPFPLLVNDQGLKVRSNAVITFKKGSEIRLKPSSKKTYNIIDIRNVSNVTLYGPVIKGDRYMHMSNIGEYGMGIAIRGGKDINIFNSRITECWGDGIYIGQAGKKFPKNITIKDSYLRNNRRDGISVIGVNGLLLENIYSGFTDGTKPMCGINFEPDNFDCEIKNVKVINPITEGNQGSGIQLSLRNLLGASSKNVDVLIVNHVDIGSKSFSFKIACNRKEETYGGSITGLINIINPIWNLPISGKPFIFTTDQPDLKVKITSPKVKNSKGNIMNPIQARSIISKHVRGDFQYSSQ